MPFTDPVSSVSGRNSRASNVSGVTGASHSVRSQRMAVPPGDTLNAGVLSMLKTSTDTGDIGALSFNSSRLPNMPRATHQRRGHHAPRLSGGSGPSAISSHHHYPSQTSRVSSAREWDSMSNQRRGSLTSMQSMPPSLPPVHLAKGPLQMPPVPDRPRDSRSYSLTSAPPMQQLPRHRSQTSLKSQGHEPRQPPYARAGPPPPLPMQENRPPYVYPTRLKRPGYRSPSPALSDTYAQAPPPSMLGAQPMVARRPPMARPPPQTYNSDYGTDYSSDPRHLNVRAPPARAMSNSPVMGYSEHQPANQLPYRHPMAMRSAPGLVTPPYAGHPPPPGAYPGSGHPHAQHHASMMHRLPYAGPPRPQYAGGPGYPHYGPMGHPHAAGRGPPSQNPHVAPAAHNLFHNAARMARQLPHRTDTPMTDTGPPSSDPPSSGTAPTSSSPPTPRDQTSIQVVVDPAFIDPALADLQDSSSEPVLPHQYFQYADGLVGKDIDDTEVDVVHPSVPPTGFVQRVRAMLESKAAAEVASKHEIERERSPQPQVIHEEDVADMHVTIEHEEIHELAADEEYRFTMVEEFDAPVELPASPVRIAELGGSPIQLSRRITREMVKAELRPSSANNTAAFEIDATDESIDCGTPSPQPPSAQAASDEKSLDPFSDVISVDQNEPSTPGPVEVNEPAEKSPESTSTSSPEALGVSAVDYAARSSVAGESSAASEGMQSRDPFVLDADTITLQHQRSKEKCNKPETFPREHTKETTPDVPCADAEPPVSPLLTGEDVSRNSAVSALRTQTLGIDENLHMASECRNDEASETSDDLAVPEPFEALPPPTPRTPKTYSKSVQLQPNNSLIDEETSNTNRFSLPPDLSTVGDTTVNTTSDMITDVAVRFSLPSTTVTVTKPQIIEIPPSSSPPPPPPKPKPVLHGSDSRTKRNSVTFADEVVAPLKINTQAEHYPLEKGSSEPRMSNKGKSAILRRPSPLQENIDARVSRDTMADHRFNNLHGINSSRFGSTHLPGLKEESVDEMSISDKHASDRTGNSGFPLPARIAAVKAMQERRLQESAEKARARRAYRHPNRPLAETRDLPSLNFSRMDLIDKLNEALEVRSSKSMEVMRRREFSGIYCPSPQRPQSTEPFRERYTSFFSKPEDFSSFFDAACQSDDEDESSTRPVSPKDTGVPTVEIQPNTEVDLEESASRPLSPEDFLSVATQVERLSIPSVSGLSERLSEILPNIHELQLDKVLAGFSSVPDDLGKLDARVRPGTVLSTRTSAGFRTLAERAEEIVKNGTHDSTVPANKLLAHKELTGLLPSASADQVSALVTNDNKQSYLSGSTSAPTDLGMEPLRPESVLTIRKSPTCIEEVNQLLPPEMNPITRNAKRALISSGSSRPWNQDENYPWAGTKVDVDLSVPSEAHTRDSLTAEAIRRRKTKSLDLTSAGELTNTTKGIDIGSIIDHETTGEVTDEQLTGVPHIHQRKQSKRSLIGSITKRIGLGGANNYATKTTSSPLAGSGSEVRNSRPHLPGERYPTSSLTPPAAFNLDEVRSFFSDDSSEKERNASLRKRLTNFKSKGKSVRLQSAQNTRSHTPEQPRAQSAVDVSNTTTMTTYDAGSTSMAVGDRLIGASSSANTYDGVGMGKAEFRIKRFGEKLRHLVAKGGDLIRSWSQRSRVPRVGSRNERVRDDWLSDSLYSGV